MNKRLASPGGAVTKSGELKPEAARIASRLCCAQRLLETRKQIAKKQNGQGFTWAGILLSLLEYRDESDNRVS
jgi:hypothetical protein